MGFSEGTYATVWTEINDNGKTVNARISTSHKEKETGNYVTDFSGYVYFVGNAYQAAKSLQPRDRIRLLKCDCTNTYNKETKEGRSFYWVRNFEVMNGTNGSNGASSYSAQPTATTTRPNASVNILSTDEDDCPF